MNLDSLTLSPRSNPAEPNQAIGALFVRSTKHKGMENTYERPPEWKWIVTTQNDVHVSVSRLNTPVVMVVCSSAILNNATLKNGGCLFELETQFGLVVSIDILQRMFGSDVASNES